MITFRQHIGLMNQIQSGKSPIEYVSNMKPLEALDFTRDSEQTYPVKNNLRKPFTDKKIHLTVESLVLGQFIMLEQIITGKTKLPDHLIDLEIAKLIIRPKHHKEFDNENIEDEKQNEKEILDMDVREVYWVLESFIENRNNTLFNQFSGVFYDPMEGEDEEEEISEEKGSQMSFQQQWYWYSIVRMLSGEDIHRYEKTYMLPMTVVLPEMSYLAQRSKIEDAERKRQQLTRKL